MFLLDLITPNRRSPGWQFILFSVLFLTFLGLTLEYYVEMKLGYVLGITLGSLVVLATIYGILVRNRGDLLEQIVERELKSNSDEYLVLDHKLSQYSQLLESGSPGSYDVGSVKNEMGKVRSRMNELDSDGRLYFGGTATSVARDDLKKTKEGYVNELVRQRQIVLGNIRDSSNRDIVADSREERELSINREVLRKINKELNRTENLYDRVGISMDEARKIADRIEVINGQIARQDQEPEEERELERQRRELQKLEGQIKDFSRPGKTKVDTMEAGEAYLEAGRRLKDVKGARTGKGKEYEQERQDRRDEEKEIKRIISLSTTTNFDGLKRETAEVLGLYKNERDNKRLLSEFNKGGLKTLEKREGLLTRYGETDVFQAMTDAQKRDFLDGKLEKSKLVDAAEKLGTYRRDLRREKLSYLNRGEQERQIYMEIKGSRAVLESRFSDLEKNYQDQLDAISTQLGTISSETPVVERSVDQKIADLSEKLGKLERNELGDLSSLPEISAISNVENGVEEWKKLENFRVRTETTLGSISDDAATKIDRQLDNLLAAVASETGKLQTAGVANNFDPVRNAIAAAVSKNGNQLDPAGTRGASGKDTIGGLNVGAAAPAPPAPAGAVGAAAPAPPAPAGAAGAADVITNTVAALKAIRDDGNTDAQAREEARNDLLQIVGVARDVRALSNKSEIKDKLTRLDVSIKDSGRDAQEKLKDLADEAQRDGFTILKENINRVKSDIKNKTDEKNPLELKRVLNSVGTIIGGQVNQQTDERKRQVTESLKRAGDNVSDPKLQYGGAAQPPDIDAITREKNAFIDQQKADLRAKLNLQKKILEKAKGTGTGGTGQVVLAIGEEGPSEGVHYPDETQDLLRPVYLAAPTLTENVDSISLTQDELQVVFQGYGQAGTVTDSPKNVGDLRALNQGNQNYKRLIDEAIASTQQNARDAIQKIQMKKFLEEQKKFLETIKKQVEEAPNSLEKQRVDAQKRIIGVREAGPVPVISF